MLEYNEEHKKAYGIIPKMEYAGHTRSINLKIAIENCKNNFVVPKLIFGEHEKAYGLPRTLEFNQNHVGAMGLTLEKAKTM